MPILYRNFYFWKSLFINFHCYCYFYISIIIVFYIEITVERKSETLQILRNMYRKCEKLRNVISEKTEQIVHKHNVKVY